MSTYTPDFETAWHVQGLAGRNRHGAQLFRASCPDCGAVHDRTKTALQQSPRCMACKGKNSTKAREARDAALIAGDGYEGWTILEECGRTEHGAPLYRALCKECGQEYQHTKSNLKKNKQCRPCASRKQALTHGLTGSSLYGVWQGMLQRCRNPKHPAYHRYGGRGITVTAAWDTFQAFYEDMHGGYAEGLELDRIDNDQGYSKENCRWATASTNCRNRSNARMLTAFGRTANLVAWADELGTDSSVILGRLQANWTVEDAVSIPVRKLKRRK